MRTLKLYIHDDNVMKIEGLNADEKHYAISIDMIVSEKMGNQAFEHFELSERYPVVLLLHENKIKKMKCLFPVTIEMEILDTVTDEMWDELNNRYAVEIRELLKRF